MCVGLNADPSLINILLKEDRMEMVNSFKYLRSCFSSNGGVKKVVSMRVGEGMRAFGAMKRSVDGRSVTVRVKKELQERVVVLTV